MLQLVCSRMFSKAPALIKNNIRGLPDSYCISILLYSVHSIEVILVAEVSIILPYGTLLIDVQLGV